MALKENIRVEGERDIQTKVLTTLFTLRHDPHVRRLARRQPDAPVEPGCGAPRDDRPRLPGRDRILILWAPAGFRVTCYYYRGAYYKAFWADPPSCAVGEPRNAFRGENSFPLILQNIYRYFLYLAIGFVVVLSYDAWAALWFEDAAGGVSFGIGVGSLVLALNAVLIGGYTFSCHSLRHLVGGRRDCISDRPLQKRAYDCVSCLNRRHMLIAWLSLVWVSFSDLYVRLCSMGVWTDLRIL